MLVFLEGRCDITLTNAKNVKDRINKSLVLIRFLRAVLYVWTETGGNAVQPGLRGLEVIE
jgi:hypothetical protein